jgi:hypothetical protein
VTLFRHTLTCRTTDAKKRELRLMVGAAIILAAVAVVQHNYLVG